MGAGSEYLSYLLRLWLAGDGGQPEWRASLEDPRTGEQRGFDSLEELFDFLRAQVEGQKPASSAMKNTNHTNFGHFQG